MRGYLSRTLALLALSSSASLWAVVCREQGFEGFDQHRVDRVKSWIGDASDPDLLRIYISRGKGQLKGTGPIVDVLFIHSNYRSTDASTGLHALYPTKIFEPSDKLKNLTQIVMNTVFFSSEKSPPDGWPDNYNELTARYLKNAEFLVDVDALGAEGRPPFDFSDVGKLRLATDDGPIDAGKVELLRTKTPPPSLIETVAGCCLKGRPAGRGHAIKRSLERLSFRPKDVALLSMVRDSATSRSISDSKVLKAAADRGGDGKGGWQSQLQSALRASRGRSLVVLGHVSKGSVVVESPSGVAEFTVPIEKLHAMAREANVNLVFLGCETARGSDASIGVVEKFNTRFAVKRLETAIASSYTPLEFLEKLSAPGMTIVAQEGAWSANGVGVTYYQKLDLKGRVRRAFRLFFLGE